MGNTPPPEREPQPFVTARPEAFVASDLNGDGTEDLVTLCGERPAAGSSRTSQPEAELDACAFDGSSGMPLWRAGPLGVLEAPRIHLDRVASKIAAIDSQGRVHVLDAATGREIAVAPLPASASVACVPADSAAKLWVEGSGFSGLLDLAAPTDSLSAVSPAPTCRCDGVEGQIQTTPDCGTILGVPGEQDLLARYAVAGAGAARVSTVDANRQPHPTVSGFAAAPGGDGRGWTRAFATPQTAPTVSRAWVARNSDLVVVAYEAGGHFKVAAYAATSGEPRWEVETGTLSDVVATDRAVYLMRLSRVEVLALADGKSIGGVGLRDDGDRAPQLAPRQKFELAAPTHAVESPAAEIGDPFDRLREVEVLAHKEIPDARLASFVASGMETFVATFQDPRPSGPAGADYRTFVGICTSRRCLGHTGSWPTKRPDFSTPTCKFSDLWAAAIETGIPKDARFQLLLGEGVSGGGWKLLVPGHPELTRSLGTTPCKPSR